ncbi:hypothetical protein OIO90_006271 [Microbotryomycetes sp. JL221]|nr:hypothetical protein OIO90_006271 [Microbotryomycetes sp. JL221]
MAISATKTVSTGTTVTLTDLEAAQIPSASLPIGPQVTHLIQEFTTLSVQLFQTLSMSSPTSNVAPILQALSRVDVKLAKLLIMLEQHQKKQQRIEQLVAQVQSQEQAWQQGVSTLHQALNQLKPVVESGSHDRFNIEQTAQARLGNEGHALEPKSILSYAKLLAPFTSAPPSSLVPPEQRMFGQNGTGVDPSGNRLPLGAIPPFPTEAVMRRGRLQFGTGLDGFAMGETEQVGVRKDGTDQVKQQNGDDAVTKQTAAARLAQQARRQEQQQEEPPEDFSFDLDLNPDM